MESTKEENGDALRKPGGVIRPQIALRSVGLRYDTLLRSYPLWTKFWTSFLMAGCSSALAQLLQGRRLRVREVLSYAAQAAPPYSHFWFVFLDKLLGPNRALLKTAMDQVIWRPLLILYMFTASGLMSGQRWPEVRQAIASNYTTAVIDGWKTWPLMIYISQRFLPAIYQSTALDSVGFLFDIHLILVQNRSRRSVDSERSLPREPVDGQS
mmetsp:Transcript_2217/g.4717  ORF Transcript_2217/g.4717 Transcript_2217/m.4717 type:complete len:211 (-) Transcript_2217:44-676(-)